MTQEFRVMLDVPSGVSLKEMCEYISDAVKTYKGGLSPDNPIWHLAPESVIVKVVLKRRT
jgi:hypothetical protein